MQRRPSSPLRKNRVITQAGLYRSNQLGIADRFKYTECRVQDREQITLRLYRPLGFLYLAGYAGALAEQFQNCVGVAHAGILLPGWANFAYLVVAGAT